MTAIYTLSFFSNDRGLTVEQRYENEDVRVVHEMYIRFLFKSIDLEDEVMSMFSEEDRSEMVRVFEAIGMIANTHVINAIILLRAIIGKDLSLTKCKALCVRASELKLSWYGKE